MKSKVTRYILLENETQTIQGKPDKKTPIGRWKHVTDRTPVAPTLENVKRVQRGELWWGHVIPTGEFLIDIDTMQQVVVLQHFVNKIRKRMGLPPINILELTLTVKTEHGYHLYFLAGSLTKDDTRGLKNQSKALTDVDLLHANTRFAALPPNKFYPKRDKKTKELLPVRQQTPIAERGNYCFVGNGFITAQPLGIEWFKLFKQCRKQAGITKRRKHSKQIPDSFNGKRIISLKNIKIGLDALSVGHFPTYDEHWPLLASLFDASGGNPKTFKALAKWSRQDPLFNNDRSTGELLNMWLGCDPDKENRYTYKTFIDLLRKHTDLPASFLNNIVIPEIRKELNRQYHKEKVNRLLRVLTES